MRHSKIIGSLMASIMAAHLGGCGGGGAHVEPIPAVPVTPPPPPSPPTPPPLPPGPIGLASNAPFKTLSASNDGVGTGQGNLSTGEDVVQFSYSAADNRYTISLPGFQAGQLITKYVNGQFVGDQWRYISSTGNNVSLGSSAGLQPVTVVLGYAASSGLSYTGIGSWAGSDNPLVRGAFAYGIPTAAGDVPVTGTAAYVGTISGLTNSGLDVFGSVSLSFDFGAATLSGVMRPEIAPVWDAIPLGNYAFKDTVFLKGSTGFSGAFDVSGSSAPSSFVGRFTGPQAAELMANWSAPYRNPLNDQWGTMVGVWIAKKP
jgi:hypothetical protein